jgi:glycosyltransferase involved in cell wall biosynthesis
LAKLKSHSWRCSFIGAGDRLESWQELARDTGIARQVEFVPPVNMGEIPKLMSNADLLVLPSRFDGWGAVVNEAIIAGVPAICSSACGARDLISESRGEVFETENVEGLAAALRRRFEQGPVSADERMKLRRWSECISGQAMAQYLTDILAHIYHGGPRPDAPWLTQAVTGGDTVAAGQARLRSS